MLLIPERSLSRAVSYFRGNETLVTNSSSGTVHKLFPRMQSTRDVHATLFLLHTTLFFTCRRCFRISLYAIMARSLSLSALSRSRADICLRFLVFGSPALAGVFICAFVSEFVSFSWEINEWSNSVFDP